ncbi:3-dehydroquinate synthase, partial [bacterium]|nr:3-dehydroquinate synthase [bacterium]
KKITVNLSENRNYDIVIDSGFISDLSEVKSYFDKYDSIMIVSNEKIFGIYGDKIRKSFKHIGKNIHISILPDGEQYKNLEYINKIYTDCIKAELDRKSLIVAFGGGVIGDMAGFAAATFMRGIDYIQIPTTLLAQVDSSVGGKTGVNHPLCKNMIGAFYQPQVVIIDIDVLSTLDRRDYISGLAEVVKYGVILDESFFSFLEENTEKILSLNKNVLEEIIFKSCAFKAKVVQEDEREKGLRTILNYGHTIGHAIETVTEYKKYLHGEAISMGMIYASKIACNKGLIDKYVISRQQELLSSLGLPTEVEDVDPQQILYLIKTDKKFVSGKPKFILPKKIGQVVIEESVSFKDVEKVL